MDYRAYLIVICDNATNAVLSATIWSSPEWDRTYVAYAVGGSNYSDAAKTLVGIIQDPHSRYHWLLKHLDERALSHCDHQEL